MPKSMCDVVIGAAKQEVAMLLQVQETKLLAAELLALQANATPTTPDFYEHLLTTLTVQPLPAAIREVIQRALYDAFFSGRDWQAQYGKPGADCVPTALTTADMLLPKLEAAIRRFAT